MEFNGQYEVTQGVKLIPRGRSVVFQQNKFYTVVVKTVNLQEALLFSSADGESWQQDETISLSTNINDISICAGENVIYIFLAGSNYKIYQYTYNAKTSQLSEQGEIFSVSGLKHLYAYYDFNSESLCLGFAANGAYFGYYDEGWTYDTLNPISGTGEYITVGFLGETPWISFGIDAYISNHVYGYVKESGVWSQKYDSYNNIAFYGASDGDVAVTIYSHSNSIPCRNIWQRTSENWSSATSILSSSYNDFYTASLLVSDTRYVILRYRIGGAGDVYVGYSKFVGGAYESPISIYTLTSPSGAYTIPFPCDPYHLTSGFACAFVDDNHGNKPMYVHFENAVFESFITYPKIESISPSPCAPNKLITITGINFGDEQNKSSVIFEKSGITKEGNVQSWSNNEITCYTPELYAGEWDVRIRRLDT